MTDEMCTVLSDVNPVKRKDRALAAMVPAFTDLIVLDVENVKSYLHGR